MQIAGAVASGLALTASWPVAQKFASAGLQHARASRLVCSADEIDMSELKDLSVLKDVRDFSPGLLPSLEGDGLLPSAKAPAQAPQASALPQQLRSAKLGRRGRQSGSDALKEAAARWQEPAAALFAESSVADTSRTEQLGSRKLGRRGRPSGSDALKEAAARWQDADAAAESAESSAAESSAGTSRIEQLDSRKLGRRRGRQRGSDALQEAAARWQEAEAEGEDMADGGAAAEEEEARRKAVEVMLEQRAKADAVNALPREFDEQKGATTRALLEAEAAEAEAVAAAARAAELRAAATRAAAELEEAASSEELRREMEAWARREQEQEQDADELRAAMQLAMERSVVDLIDDLEE